jgi:hypothetical protein
MFSDSSRALVYFFRSKVKFSFTSVIFSPFAVNSEQVLFDFSFTETAKIIGSTLT